MNYFRTLLVGLSIVTAVPAHGMWQEIKRTIGLQSGGLTEDTKACMLGAWSGAVAHVIGDKLFHPNPCMAQLIAEKPLQMGANTALFGIGIPLLFYLSLKNNPDFWNKEGFCNRAFLMLNTYLSTVAALNLHQLF